MTINLKLQTIFMGLGVLAVAFVLLASISVATWEYTNSDNFCSNACHNVHPEETYAHHGSQHASVQCVECHLGRISTLRAMAAKASHTSHAWALMVGYERPLTAPSMPASRDSCESCHSAQPHQNNSIKVRHHYAPDETNTETKIALILRTAGRQVVDEDSKGIHWHTDNEVRFVAKDPQKRTIPWVESIGPDGSKTLYKDVTTPEADVETAQTKMRLMECTDCHNQTGHPFQNPEEVVDRALARDPVIRRLPYVKDRLVKLLNQDFETKEEALALAEQAWEQYKRDFPNLAEDYPDVWTEAKKFMRERIEFMADLKTRSKFLEPDLSWRSFPDHSGHKYSAGCFRCHSGKHRDADGIPIAANCTLCHSVPIVIRRGEIPRNLLAIVDVAKPPNHQRADFMFTHRTLIDDTCAACHGEIRFGTDDKTFCANSGCHGTTWPNLVLSNP